MQIFLCLYIIINIYIALFFEVTQSAALHVNKKLYAGIMFVLERLIQSINI